MSFIDSIFSLVWDISGYFYNAYYEVSGWVYPFYYLATPLYWLYRVTWNLLTPIAQFGDLVDNMWSRVQNILSEAQILSLLSAFISYATNSWNWVSNAGWNVWVIVNNWWSGAQLTVIAWVNEAKLLAQSLFNQVSSGLASIQAAWDNFKGMIPSISEVIAWFGDWWAKILAPLTIWWNGKLLDVQGLINSNLKSWLPFYDDLVGELFFMDPEDWLYKAFDRIIERFW